MMKDQHVYSSVVQLHQVMNLILRNFIFPFQPLQKVCAGDQNIEQIKRAFFLFFLAVRISLLFFYLVFEIVTDPGLLKIQDTSLRVCPRCGFAFISVITYIHSLSSFLKQGFSKIITISIITNKIEYSKYIKSGLVKLSKN